MTVWLKRSYQPSVTHIQIWLDYYTWTSVVLKGLMDHTKAKAQERNQTIARPVMVVGRRGGDGLDEAVGPHDGGVRRKVGRASEQDARVAPHIVVELRGEAEAVGGAGRQVHRVGHEGQAGVVKGYQEEINYQLR